MDPSNRYSPSSHPTYDGLGSLHPPPTDFDFEPQPPPNYYQRSLLSHHASAGYAPVTVPPQYTTAYNPTGVLSARDDWHQPPTEHGSLVHDRPNPIGLFFQPQRTYLSHEDKGVQTTQSGPTNEGNDRQELSRTHRQQTSRSPVRQETYKLTRGRAGFQEPKVIEFVVDGKEGIRLSDALEGNWGDFEGRDDRSMFDGDRLQIMIRLQLVGCSPWQSKIPITDFTKKRRPITRMRLAVKMAKTIQKFIAREKLNGHVAGHPECGWGDVSLENVLLYRMVRVSAASWQPEIRVERPSIPSQAASSSSQSSNTLA